MNLELRHLRLLVAVTEEGSLTRAGKRLHATQSALSHQLRDAEERIGQPLFLRRKDRMVPTEMGENLLPVARRVLEELARAHQFVPKNGGVRNLRISTECFTSFQWLPRVLPEFRKRHPAVQVVLDPESNSGPIEALLAGQIDLAILCRDSRRPGIRQEPLFEDELVLVFPPQHPLTKRREVRPAALEGETLLVYPPKEACWLHHDVLAPLGVTLSRVVEVPLTEGIIELVAAGAGVAYMARWSIAPYIDAGVVAARKLQGSAPRTWLAASMMSVQPAYLREFIELLRESIPGRKRLLPAM